MRTKFSKWVLGLGFASIMLCAIPTETSAAIICKQGGLFTSFPDSAGSCPITYTQATAAETAAYAATPAGKADLAKSVTIDKSKIPADDFDCRPGTILSNCIAAMVYYVGPGLASNVAYVGAYFFSFVIQLSLNSTAYALTFLSEGWELVRDLANMAFIFILIFIALKVMFQAEETGTIKTLAIVVVVALLVNFSFFFTRVVIDAGNLLAVQFYNAIPMEQNADKTDATLGGVKDLSASIMNAVKLQTLYGSKAFDNAKNACGTPNNGVMCGLIVTTIVYLAVAIMFWMLFFAFLTVGIKFMLRIVGLWFVLIASPLAFVAKTMTKTEPYFKQWLSMLVQFSLYPAIFLFMFFILSKFTKALLTGTDASGKLFNAAFQPDAGAIEGVAGYAATIASVSIRMGFVIALFYVALKVSDWVVKEGSGVANTIATWPGSKIGGAMRWAGRTAGNTAARTGGGLYTHAVGGVAYDVNAALKGTRFGNSRLGAFLRRNTFEPLSKSTVGGAKPYTDVAQARKDRFAERQNNLRDVETKRIAAEVGEAVRSNIQGGRTAAHNISDADKERLKGLSKRELENFKADDLTNVAAVFSEDQIKKIAEIEKFTDEEKEQIRMRWQEHSVAAPLQKTLTLLGEIAANSPAARAAVTTARTTNTLIDTTWMNNLKVQLTTEFNEANAAFGRNRTVANSAALNAANEARNKFKEANEAREKIPALRPINNNTGSAFHGNRLPVI